MQDNQPTLDSPIDIPRIARIYDQTAAFYDDVVAAQQAGPKLVALEVLARQRGERVLEVGVGTAWAFEKLIEASGSDGAIGVDVAMGMLEVARQRVPDASLMLADALRLPFAGRVVRLPAVLLHAGGAAGRGDAAGAA